MRYLILIMLFSGLANASNLKVLFHDHNWKPDGCQLLYFESTDVEYLDAAVGDLLHSEYYFSCDDGFEFERIKIPGTETRFSINGQMFNCPLIRYKTFDDYFDATFDCSAVGIFKNGFEAEHPWP